MIDEDTLKRIAIIYALISIIGILLLVIVERGDGMSRCKSCGAEIRWIKMSSGKAMPVDPDQVLYWERPGAAGKVVTPNGEVYSCDFEGDPQSATGVGYVSHFSTCPNADQHRRR